MRSLTAEELLIAAERLRLEPLPRRGATLLAWTSADDAMTLPVGERDARLLALRAATFGRELAAVASCPACSQTCEVMVDAALLAAGEPVPLEVQVGSIRARLPNGHDVLAAMAAADPRHALLKRCVIGVDPAEISDEVATAIEEALEHADPRADLRLELTCPACGGAFENALDITSFFWIEIRTAAARLAREVHTLASAYGWSEGEILGMTAWRRQLYVELVSA